MLESESASEPVSLLESELGLASASGLPWRLALESPSEPMLEFVSGLPWGLGLESASELELDSASVSQSALELGLE
jgi:hypothetical protein